MDIINNGSVVSPKGFKAIGGNIGIKDSIKDMAIIVSDVPAAAAGVFTTNLVRAASVTRNEKVLAKGGKISAIIANSGNANACTGEAGMKANEEMALSLAKELKIDADAVLTASTGVIGVPFPIDKVKEGVKNLVPGLGSEESDGLLAAESIMTTDTYRKHIAVEIEIADKRVVIGGIAK
ncbi:MAG: bifunctional ornithine acetyltransferase/N-acetylglutamate synthase, partial [Firmicutes bacterium]|nr:bifunctional ornithine acetyltransferase/N-acetylglutamate synthase [Bacillota bacterium]